MTIEEFLQELYRDELSDVFAGNRNVALESRPKLFPLMNTAMTNAYSRWKIKYASEMLDITTDVHEYELVATDVLQIVQLMNVYGLEIALSDYQVLGKTLYFPTPERQTVEVVYKPKPVKFTVEQDDALTELELPEMLIPWLKAYVCHRYFAAMKSEAALTKAADYLIQVSMCENVFANTNTTGEFTAPINRKLDVRGFN
jgi:hypothetical protein